MERAKPRSVPVRVMSVGEMGVAVAQERVAMPVAVRLGA
ncbi:hypothetical protein [Azospirillum argentinense]